MDYEEILTIKAAWYYYSQNLTQQQISLMLGISRIKVIKLLEKARATGVVQFNIRQDSTKLMDIEQRLVNEYDLMDAFVVPASFKEEDTNENIAKAAAMYIANRMSDNQFINLGYGDTSGKFLNHLATMTKRTISVVSLTGGVSYYLPNECSNAFNAKLYLIPAPLMASTKEMATAMLQESSVKEVSRMIQLSGVTVVGIGAMDDAATLLQGSVFNKSDFLLLKMRGAVGDILSHFIDKDGNLLASAIEDRLISTPIHVLKEMKKVIGVAAGTHKVEAIRAALIGKYLNILITDEETARKLLAISDIEQEGAI